MKIAVLGTGTVGQVLAGRLSDLGHDVTVGTRDPQALGTSSFVFVSGDDATAKEVVVELLTSFGHDDVIDLGGIETARGAEMHLPLWLRLMGALGTPHFNVKVVR